MCTRAMISGVDARCCLRAEPRELFLMQCSYAMPGSCSCVVLRPFTACNEHKVRQAFVAGRTSLPLLRSSLRPPTPRRPCQGMRAAPTSVVRPLAFVSLVLRLFSVLLQTLQHLCDTALVPTVHSKTALLQQNNNSARVPPWLRWQQRCHQASLAAPRIFRKWRHGPIDDARRAVGVDRRAAAAYR